MTKTKVVLLACGSFNPPTFMHLRMFELARDHINRLGPYQVISGIISPVHDAYNKKELISSTHRCSLIKLALQDSDWIHLSDWECNQEGWTPTRQILQYHQNRLNASLNSNDTVDNKILNDNDEITWVKAVKRFQNNGINVVIKLLCGADLLQSFSTPGLWKDSDIESIVGDHGLAVITRAGNDPQSFVYESDLLTKYKNNINIITEWIVNEVSSTKIRRSLRRGESVKYLVKDSVIDYIKSQYLYGSVNNKYHMFTNSSLYQLTPSPSDVILAIDSSDSGNYSRPQSDVKIPRPGIAIPTRKVIEENEIEEVEEVDEVVDEVEEEEDEEEEEEEEEETRVEIQITEDGRIEVISDKETTV